MQRIIFHKGDLPFYLAIAGIFMVMKLGYSQCSIDDLRGYLVVVDGLVKLVTNSGSHYLPAQGFYHANLNILINKSCSGFNFFALCFMMLAFMSVRHLRIGRHRITAIAVSLVLAYVLALFVNVARILTSIELQRLGASLHLAQTGLIHQAEGAFIYLFFLIAIYAVFNSLLTKKVRAHAEVL